MVSVMSAQACDSLGGVGSSVRGASVGGSLAIVKSSSSLQPLVLALGEGASPAAYLGRVIAAITSSSVLPALPGDGGASPAVLEVARRPDERRV